MDVIIHEAITDIGEMEEVDVRSAFPLGCDSNLSNEVQRAIDKFIDNVPDANDPDIMNYWEDINDKAVYLEGWCDGCLAGTGFNSITEGGWSDTSNKADYMFDLTKEILPRKAGEKKYTFIEGGFRQFPAGTKGFLYGVTWGVYEK